MWQRAADLDRGHLRLLDDLQAASFGTDVLTRNADYYAVALDEARRALDDQTAELNNIRGRALSYLGFVGAATAFLAGTGIRGGHRSAGFYVLTALAYLLAIGAVALVVGLLNPWRTQMSKRVQAGILIAHWTENPAARLTGRADMARQLAIHYDMWRVQNEAALQAVRRRYLALVVTGAVDVALWSVVVWIAA